MRFFAVIDVEVVNLMRKKVEIDLIWFANADYLRCELHNCRNWTRCSLFTFMTTDTSDHGPISLAPPQIIESHHNFTKLVSASAVQSRLTSHCQYYCRVGVPSPPNFQSPNWQAQLPLQVHLDWEDDIVEKRVLRKSCSHNGVGCPEHLLSLVVNGNWERALRIGQVFFWATQLCDL